MAASKVTHKKQERESSGFTWGKERRYFVKACSGEELPLSNLAARWAKVTCKKCLSVRRKGYPGTT